MVHLSAKRNGKPIEIESTDLGLQYVAKWTLKDGTEIYTTLAAGDAPYMVTAEQRLTNDLKFLKEQHGIEVDLSSVNVG